MHWLSFFIGALVGWLVCWLIDFLICRPRRMATEAELREGLESANKETASLKAQLAAHKDLQARLDGANARVTALKAQVAQQAELQARLDNSNGEIGLLKAQLAGMGDLQMRLDACQAEAGQNKAEIERLNTDLTAAWMRVDRLTPAADDRLQEIDMTQAATQIPAADVVVATPAALLHKPDDLTVIEGIGAKISELLDQNGISTFAQLAAASAEHLRAILDSGGARFRTANPETWPQQALLAHDGKWDALKTLQDALQRGRRV